jgi:hypothetical protein
MKTVIQAAALIAAIATIGGGAWAFDARYAKVEQVAGNAEAIAIIRIENARQSGNGDLLARLCDDFSRVYGWTPSACR